MNVFMKYGEHTKLLMCKFLLYNVKKANPKTSHILSFVIFEPGGPWS
jgi:hypothetical protein